MTVTREAILKALDGVALPDGGSLVSRDLIRALAVADGTVRFVIEPDARAATLPLGPLRAAAEEAVAALPGVRDVTAVIPAQDRGKAGAAPSMRIGRHADPSGPHRPSGVDRIIAIGSGKGGVGKSTVSANLAVALARQGRRVGLLDADIYGPSQPRMMGINRRPSSPDGKTIIPLQAHGVTVMSIGLMLQDDEAVIWRGPMLMGALQQMLTQVQWGALDVLIVDMPPGTGDIQLTLCQRTQLTGAIVVSTPQEVSLLDARKAIGAFRTLKTPVLGLIENMSRHICPKCGHETDIFGAGGVEEEAARQGLPFLGALPISVEVRESGDAGRPVALGDGPVAQAYAALATRLVQGGMA